MKLPQFSLCTMKLENTLFKITPALEQNTLLFESTPFAATRKVKGLELTAYLLRFLVVAGLLMAVLITEAATVVPG